MPGRRRRRQDGADRSATSSWLTTYSDMVTLLLAFFVMLWTFAEIDVTRFRSIITSLQGSLGVLDGGRTVTPEPSIFESSQPEGGAFADRRSGVDDIGALLESFVERTGLQADLQVTVEERGVVVRFADRVLFDIGRAELKPQAQEVLAQLADELAEWPNLIRVEGHTDDWPIRMAYPSNWELSTARASAVVRFFVAQGLSPTRLTAAGYGEYRPIADNRTEDGRQRNRRVDIVLLRVERVSEEPGPINIPGPTP